MLLDFFGGMLLTAAMVVNVNAIISTLNVSRVARLSLAAVVGLWIGAQVALATAGAFGNAFASAFPLIGVVVAAPPLAVAIAASMFPGVRRALLELPMTLLIGLNFNRIFGVFFLMLALGGRLGGPFPLSAGWGDIIVGVTALPLALLAARKAVGASALFWWNAFGTIDLIAAVTLGTLSFNGSAWQAIEAGSGADAIQFLPWVLIPTVLVPFYLIVHGVIFAQLRESRMGRPALA